MLAAGLNQWLECARGATHNVAHINRRAPQLNPAGLEARCAARLLGRDRTRVYALIRSGDLVAVPVNPDEGSGPLRIDRASLECWLVSGGGKGGPFSLRTPGPSSAWPAATRPFRSAVSACSSAPRRHRARAPLGKLGMFELAPRLRRRASSLVLRLAAQLVTARTCGDPRPHRAQRGARAWLDRVGSRYAMESGRVRPIRIIGALQEQTERLHDDADEPVETVLLRVVDGPWPFPPHSQLAPQPWRRSTCSSTPTRRPSASAARPCAHYRAPAPRSWPAIRPRARVLASPRMGKLLADAALRAPQPSAGDGDPRTDTPARPRTCWACCGPAPAAVRRSGNCARADARAAGSHLIESVRGNSSDSTIGTLLQRQLIALDDHRLFTTTPALLEYLGLRDLADLLSLPELETEASLPGTGG